MNAAIEQQSGSRRKRRFICLCSFLADLLIFVLAFYAVWIAVRGHRGRADFSTFKYFTTDSNAFAGAVSLLAAAYTLPVLLGKKECVPKPVLILKYVGTCSVALTFFVVLLFLGGDFRSRHDVRWHRVLYAWDYTCTYDDFVDCSRQGGASSETSFPLFARISSSVLNCLLPAAATRAGEYPPHSSCALPLCASIALTRFSVV